MTGGTASRHRTRPARSGRVDSRDREVSRAGNSHQPGSPGRVNRGRGINTGDSHSRDSHGDSRQDTSSHNRDSHSGARDSRERRGMVEA
jgi:hypothetical protein